MLSDSGFIDMISLLGYKGISSFLKGMGIMLYAVAIMIYLNASGKKIAKYERFV